MSATAANISFHNHTKALGHLLGGGYKDAAPCSYVSPQWRAKHQAIVTRKNSAKMSRLEGVARMNMAMDEVEDMTLAGSVEIIDADESVSPSASQVSCLTDSSASSLCPANCTSNAVAAIFPAKKKRKSEAAAEGQPPAAGEKNLSLSNPTLSLSQPAPKMPPKRNGN